ncbi:NAD(P)-binding protein, partial [Cadophora sp. DSE1049]
SNIILVLGAGPNVGIHITKYFSEKAYKTAAVARNPSEEVIKAADLVIKADFSDASNIKPIFDEVKEKLGIPNVVVYNAYANPMGATGDPFAIPLSEFVAGLNINMISPYAAMSEAISGFKELPKETLKTFIYTGNVCLHLVLPVALNLGLGKRGVGHMIENAVMLYEKEGYNFYFADERFADASPMYQSLNGDAHAEFYYELATKKEQAPWEATFVKGKGYVDFDG